MNQFLSYLEIGVRDGLVYALLALGMVLVYKGSRILNFAHPYFGLLCAYLCWWLTSHGKLFGIQLMPFAAASKPRFALAIVLSLVLIGLNGFAAEHGVIRRLRGGPRLVTLVATIALAQGSLGTVLLLFNRNEAQASVFKGLPPLLGWSFGFGSRIVTGADILVLIVVPIICAALALFFTRTRFGVAIRAAAENAEAARLLGISADRVSAFTWVTGSVLAGLAGILIVGVRGSLDISTLSTGFLVRGLAAALVGGLTSLPGAVVGGLSVGVAEAMLRWRTNDQPGVPETLLFVVIILLLAFRPQGLFGQREETEDKVAFVPTLKELPSKLRASPAAKVVRWAALIFVAFACGLSLVTNSKTNGTFTLIVIYGMVGVSLTVLMGYTGQISLGHWGLVGVGAFAMANLVTRLHVPYLLALPLSVVIGMVVSLIIGLPALRIRGLYLAVATLAFNLAAEFYIFKSRLIGGSTAGLQLQAPKLGPIDLDDPSRRPIFFFSLFMLGIVMLLVRNLARSRTGRGFFALRENEKAAATLGVGLTRYKLLSFAVSGGIAALAGALHVTYLGFTDSNVWDTSKSLLLVSLVMIGGLGSIAGSLLGSFVVIGLPQLLDFANDWLVTIGTGVLLIVVIVRARGGVAGVVQRVQEQMVGALAEMSEPEPRADAHLAEVIVADQLTRQFGGRPAVQDVSFSVAAGEVVGFLGPNGAGKTTTMRMLLGLLRPSSGAAEVPRPVGYLPEVFAAYDGLSVRSYLRYQARLRRVPDDDIARVLKAVDGSDLARRPVGRLSKGQRQRVGLAQALLGSPPALILDEPMQGLDPAQVVSARALVRRLASEGAAVLLSTHQLAEAAATCDRVVVIVRGKVVAEERPGEAVDLEARFLRLVGEAELGVMRATLRKELAVLWLSPLPYVVGVLFHIVLAVLYTNQLEARQQALLQPLFPVAGFLLVAMVPALAMRTFAEEARTGSLDLLLAIPAPTVRLVVGKWLACWLTAVAVAAPSAMFAVLVGWWGNPDAGPAIAGYVGLALLAATLCGLGVLASALTSSQPVAAMVAFFLALLLWFSHVGSETLSAGGALAHFSLSERLRAFAAGVIDTGDVGFFLVVTAAALVVAATAVDGRRLR